jgi:hypothetical protein
MKIGENLMKVRWLRVARGPLRRAGVNPILSDLLRFSSLLLFALRRHRDGGRAAR